MKVEEFNHVKIINADVMEGLATLADESVHCVVTSPPYWGLRDYGTATWEGGDPDCDHKGEPKRTQSGFNERYFDKPSVSDKQGELTEPVGNVCPKCGAQRVDLMIGLEPTLDCGKTGLIRLRSDLSKADLGYVIQQLLDLGLLDVLPHGKECKE